MTQPTPKLAKPHTLKRVVRFSINPAGSTAGNNTFAGKPSMTGLGRYYEIQLAISGHPCPDTGYLVGIQEIDALVRTHLTPIIAEQIKSDPTTHPGLLLKTLWQTAAAQIEHTLWGIRWNLTPYYCVEMTSSTNDSNAVLIRQRFEFAAAHRLHTDALSNEQNASFFGKCNNASGHGHNYQLEPCIKVPADLLKANDFQLQIEQAVNETLIDQLDHKFLNTDCPWFDQSQGGVIPSIENIARVCHQHLAPEIAQIADGIELVSLSAWETEKTSCTYPTEAH